MNFNFDKKISRKQFLLLLGSMVVAVAASALPLQTISQKINNPNAKTGYGSGNYGD